MRLLASSGLDVFAHNVETVERLQKRVRIGMGAGAACACLRVCVGVCEYAGVRVWSGMLSSNCRLQLLCHAQRWLDQQKYSQCLVV